MEDNKEKKYILKILNPATSRKEEVEVTEEVYKEFKRSYWREHKNNQKHKYYEIPFSALTVEDSETDACEFYEEFESEDLPLDLQLSLSDECERYLSCLSPCARKRMILHYFEGYTLESIAQLEGTSFQAIECSLKHSIKKIRKIFKL